MLKLDIAIIAPERILREKKRDENLGMEEPQVEELQKSYMSKFMDGTTGSLTNQEALTTEESAKISNAILVEDPNVVLAVNPG